MSNWTEDELDRIGSSDELELASLNPTGALRSPVTIWVVRVGDDLFVRSARGRSSHWFRGAAQRHEGRIRAGGVEKDVTFAETDDGATAVDAAYQRKYANYPAAYRDPLVAEPARSATLRLVPNP